MAISSVTNRVAYQGNGTSASFAFGYELHSPQDVAVFLFNSSATTDGIIRALQLNASGPYGYTFDGTLNSQGVYPTGGFVVLNSTPNVQTAVVIFRSSVVTASFGVDKFQPIPGDALTNAIDRLTMLAQRAQDIGTRSVRLKDGFYGTFDPSLPENILQSAGKRLIVNSSANGFTFDETLASYIPNTLAYANTNSSVTSLGGSPDGRVLLSRGSSAPEWARVNLGSSESVTGILPVANGGTGAAGFSSSAPIRSNGLAQFFNGSTSLANEVVGVLPIANGGTGIGPASLDQFGVVVMSSTTQMTVVPSGTPGSLLTANSGAAPTFQAFSASNINSGYVAVANGGTGVGTILPQFGLLYAASATQVGNVPSAQQGWVLTAFGSSAPQFQPVSVSKNVVAVGTTYLTTNSDATVLLSNSTAYTVTLYDPTVNSGKEIFFKMRGAGRQAVNIVGSGVNFYMVAQNEVAHLQSNGTQWDILDQKVLQGGGRTILLHNGLGLDYGPPVSGTSAFRILNFQEADTTFCVLSNSASIFILQPGIYYLTGQSVYKGTGSATSFIDNLKDGSRVMTGTTTSVNSSGGASISSHSFLSGRFSLNTSSTLALRYRTGAGGGSDALGNAGIANSSIYAVLNIEKIG